MKNVDLTYSAFLSTIAAKFLAIQFSETPDQYFLFAIEGNISWETVLLKGTSDATDFETNYKASSNKPLFPPQVNFKDLGDNIPIALVNIAANKIARVIDLEIPAGKRWDISSWDASGSNDGFYELIELFGTQVDTLRDAMDATTGWSITVGPGTLSLDTTDKVQGTGSLKISGTGTGGAQITLQKTVSPTQNWSADSEVAFWCKASSLTNSPKVWLRVSQAATTYTFSQQALGTAWNEFRFDLTEITNFDKTAVSKVEIFVKNTASRDFHFDELHTLSLGDSSEIDHFFSGAKVPYNHIFSVPIQIPAGHRVIVNVTNKQGVAGDFEVGMNGNEVTI